MKRAAIKLKVMVIVGPTASGKTALSLFLAKRFNGEIVSADSRQIYREMDIGTAKPPPDRKRANSVKMDPVKMNSAGKEPLSFYHDRGKMIVNKNSKDSEGRSSGFGYFSDGVKHHLVDIRNPNQDYSVGQFKKDAVRAIGQILKKGKLPIVVGGTGLYVSALVDNLEIPPVRENKELRARIEKEIKGKGLDYAFEKLISLDPEAVYIVDPKNPRRVIRALEVALTTGKSFTAQRKKSEPLYDFLQIGIKITPEILKRKIASRVDQMVNDGLIPEIKKLTKKYGYKAKPFDAIGYREIIEYLDGEISLEEAIAKMFQNTWRYAKRQMTWFSRDKRIHWLGNPKMVGQAAREWLK